MLEPFNAHAQLTALTEGHVKERFAPRRTTEVRFAKRIAMQVRRKQARELGL